ncbi:MAG: STAS domain-containing protein [Negativicutes bacterium]|nr:STAS domain-containing protein [Negativicutes bacterium]
MNYKIDENDGTVNIALPVRLYFDEAAVIREAAMTLIDQGKLKFFFDFSNVAYIDSSGLSMLVALHRAVQGHGGKIAVEGLTGTVREIFRMTKLDKLFENEQQLERNEG